MRSEFAIKERLARLSMEADRQCSMAEQSVIPAAAEIRMLRWVLSDPGDALRAAGETLRSSPATAQPFHTNFETGKAGLRDLLRKALELVDLANDKAKEYGGSDLIQAAAAAQREARSICEALMYRHEPKP